MKHNKKGEKSQGQVDQDTYVSQRVDGATEYQVDPLVDAVLWSER